MQIQLGSKQKLRTKKNNKDLITSRKEFFLPKNKQFQHETKYTHWKRTIVLSSVIIVIQKGNML